MTPEARKDALLRLRRVAGQIAGLERMLEEERYCVDVLLQIAAARAALTKVGKVVLASHVATCVADAARRGPDERRKKLDELLDVFDRYGG